MIIEIPSSTKKKAEIQVTEERNTSIQASEGQNQCVLLMLCSSSTFYTFMHSLQNVRTF